MRTPAEHYLEADRLLASLSDDQFGLPFARARVAAAHAHAVLASCPHEYGAREMGWNRYPDVVDGEVTGDRL